MSAISVWFPRSTAAVKVKFAFFQHVKMKLILVMYGYETNIIIPFKQIIVASGVTAYPLQKTRNYCKVISYLGRM